ncbi:MULTISPECIES: sterol desaturase family protein [Exiguobacterium]|uniref:sterol desaturase family protein n=1 Tax=Exiguobacterium TaxID=33986 RepID=UPI000494C961|nr:MULTISPECIES: sterol desaturase family protein [Exiguobacterium]HCD59403.1 fatty acid hydroxylase [Exiguobacterium sp.]
MSNIYRRFFLFPDILIMLVLLIAISSYVFAQPFHWSILLFFCLGLIIFSFSEYLTHRFLFHLPPPKNTFGRKLLKRLHYDHHAHPNELHLLFLPVWYSLPNLSFFVALTYLLMQSVVSTAAAASGLIVMLLVYEWKHYVAHVPLKPRTRFGKWMKKTHLLHHFKNEHYWFGVSNPVGDWLFGTLKDEKTVTSSQTARNLEKNREYEKPPIS